MSRLATVSDFIAHAEGIARGLIKAYATDIDVFLIFTAGGLLGARSRHLRALGTALGVYTVLRRTDGYVAVTTSRIEMLSRVIADHKPVYHVPASQLRISDHE